VRRCSVDVDSGGDVGVYDGRGEDDADDDGNVLMAAEGGFRGVMMGMLW
jgi:hypothetical protein